MGHSFLISLFRFEKFPPSIQFHKVSSPKLGLKSEHVVVGEFVDGGSLKEVGVGWFRGFVAGVCDSIMVVALVVVHGC